MNGRLAAAVSLLAGCALFSKSEPLDIRYYAPPAVPSESRDDGSATKVRLGDVSSGSHLRSRIAYRASPTEIELYEERRWTEPPHEYARRALEQELVARGVLVTGGKALELEVEVVGFEIVEVPVPAGRVALRYLLIDDRTVVREDVVEVVRPGRADFDSLVTAIGGALEEASERVVAEAMRTQ